MATDLVTLESVGVDVSVLTRLLVFACVAFASVRFRFRDVGATLDSAAEVDVVDVCL